MKCIKTINTPVALYWLNFVEMLHVRTFCTIWSVARFLCDSYRLGLSFAATGPPGATNPLPSRRPPKRMPLIMKSFMR